MKRIVAIVIVSCSAVVSGQPPSGSAVEWPYVGGDQAHTKYSALDDIDLANVDQLEIAWQWDAGETPLPDARPGSFQATPLMNRRHALLLDGFLARRGARCRHRGAAVDL